MVARLHKMLFESDWLIFHSLWGFVTPLDHCALCLGCFNSKRSVISNLLNCKTAKWDPISCISAATWWLGTERLSSGDTHGDSGSRGRFCRRTFPSRIIDEKSVPVKKGSLKLRYYLKKYTYKYSFVGKLCILIPIWKSKKWHCK